MVSRNMTQFDSYFICTSPRSGSTLLCKLLEDCSAGHPASYFHRPSLNAWRSGLDLPDDAPRDEIFSTARKRSKGKHPISGIRLQRHSFEFFCAQLALLKPDQESDLSRITATFGRTAFIHLTRTDKLDQAVSLIRAQQSGLWHRNADGSELERTGAASEVEFNPAIIQAEWATLTQMDLEWEQWFTKHKIAPLRVTYSALATDPRPVMHRILTGLGLSPEPARSISPRTAKLADHVNADWVARFRAQTT